MLQNPRLGAPAYAHLHFSISYEWPSGYRLAASGRREASGEWESEAYDSLDPFELADLLQTVLALRLGI